MCSRRDAGRKFPVVVNFHGGGFTLGKATDDARWATDLVDKVDVIVVSVDYRLAPEYPFPTAVEDGVDAILFLVERAEELGLDVRRFVISGFSAGGNLAFTVPLMLYDRLQEPCRHRKWSTRLWNTIERRCYQDSFESTDGFEHCGSDCMVPMLQTIRRQPPIRRATCTRPEQAMPNFFVDLFDASYIYPRSCDKSNPFLSPGIASADLLSLLPNNIILFTCEWDMLRAEAETFGTHLRSELGKTVTHTMIPEVAHAWDRTTNPFHIDSTVSQYYEQACLALESILETSA